MKHIHRIFTISFLLLSLSPLAAQAQIAPGEEKFLFHLGYFLPSFSTKLAINNDALGVGDEVNAEDDLGIDAQQNIIRTDISWRFAEKHRLELGYFAFNRNGEKVLSREIQIGDEIYPVSATINTSLKLTTVPIYYYYSFLKTSDLEIAGGLGLQWSKINFSITGSTSLGGGDATRDAVADADGPLPLLSFDLVYYVTPQWDLGANLGVFSYKVGSAYKDYQGSVATASVSTDYWFSDNFGAGAALNYFDFDVEVKSRRWTGNFNYQYWGPQIFLSAKF